MIDEPLARRGGGAESDVDALVASLHPGAPASPGVQTRDVVLVTGPWLAGATSVVDGLRSRLPDRTFVEASDLSDDDAPVAVVFVVSAVAPLADSDCVLLDAAAARTDLVIGAVSKIDVHRDWRDVLAVDKAAMAARNPRYRDMTWVGVAAAPERGAQRLDELADAIENGLSDHGLPRRNRLRSWHTRLQTAIRRHEDAAAGVGHEARMTTLREQRIEELRQRRLAKSERTIALRSRVQQAKVQLTYFARNRCTSVRGELVEDCGGMTRRELPDFEKYVARRVADVVDEVNEGVDSQLADLAAECGLTAPDCEPPPPGPSVSSPSLAKGGLDSRLMMVLGAAFGLGVALTLSRLVAGLAPAYTAGGLIVGAAVGLAVAAWVISVRRTLRDRAILERWIGEVIGELRAVVEELVATRMVRAESVLTTAGAERDEAEATATAQRVAAIDGEMREHAVAAAQAAAARDREIPGLQRALDVVQIELDDLNLNRSCE